MASAAAAAPPVVSLPYRVGHGFDLHRLAEGYKLIIGGIDIPHTKGCEAHSDGAARLEGGRLGVVARGRAQLLCGCAWCSIGREGWGLEGWNEGQACV